ncbi:permease-like cell division protein FtsX [Clostridium isatidis]|uniref:Cell division protein FtsX n=1 Tax=Clostridium isatidis TaxID=182773 RepID=A0A343JFF2_9CLOT|nr:permease-like cell division protein FtsX [Clostridium isatidis]ASW44260.1 cell division protein FtsX [Clostridium isatidis]NLZ34949.1 ABC transporter permease [Clostridiales bacterium]
MKINSMKYFFIDAFKSLKRNRTLSIAAIITVLITFFIFGTFALLGLNFSRAVEDVASKIEIKVYLKDDIKLVDQREIEIKLSEQEGVEEVIYETKEEAFLNFKESFKDNPGLIQGYDLEKNPLQNSYIVKLEAPEYADSIEAAVKDMAGVDDITNAREMIESISSFVNAVRVIGMVLFVVFIGVSIFLITNTTKITVFSRRREIGIMKYVGATDWFIRWPFIIEGIVIGLIGSILSVFLLFFAYKGVYNYIVSSVFIANIISPSFILGPLGLGFILGGAVIGSVGSAFALRKFLDV